MSPIFLTFYCGLLLTVSAFSNDVMLPALFAIHGDLGGTMEDIQLAFPVFVLVSAAGQLVFGPASDRFGRRVTIMTGLSFYIAGSMLATVAGGIGTLLAGRACQGLGSACCQVVARAILRDTHHGMELARAMALSMAIFALGPIFAPLLGYGLISLGTWRFSFAAMLALGVLLLATSILGLKETNASPDPQALAPRRFSASFMRVLKHPQSRFFLIAASLLYFGIISYIANAPRLYRSAFGIDGIAFALLFSTAGIGLFVTQIANNRLILRFGVLATTRAAAVLLALAAGSVLALAALDALDWISFTALMLAFNSLFLIVFANAASLVIDPHKDIAGLASSIFGATTQLFGSLMMFLTLPIFKGAMIPWSVGLCVVGALVAIGLLLYRRDVA